MSKSILCPVKIIDEIDSFYSIPSIMKSLGSRTLLVHGRNFLKHYGYLEKLEQLFEEKNTYLTEYSVQFFESDIRDVLSCIRIIREKSIDSVLAIGGGAVIDTAKAAAGICFENDPQKTFESSLPVKEKGLPFVASPTTAGTGAEVTPNAVISNTKKHLKKSIRSSNMYPRFAVLDAKLTQSAPPTVTAYSGGDALCQAIEAFVSIEANNETDELSRKAISLIGHNLEKAYHTPLDLTARKKILTGSNLAAIAFSNCRLGAVHGMAHPIGVRYNIPHGLICAILLPPVMEHNIGFCLKKYAEIRTILSNSPTENERTSAILAIQIIKDMFQDMDLDKKLSDFGADLKDIDVIVEESLASSSLKHNPRPFKAEDVIAVYKKCL